MGKKDLIKAQEETEKLKNLMMLNAMFQASSSSNQNAELKDHLIEIKNLLMDIKTILTSK